MTTNVDRYAQNDQQARTYQLYHLLQTCSYVSVSECRPSQENTSSKVTLVRPNSIRELISSIFLSQL